MPHTLSIFGKNQLAKEIEETFDMDVKMFDKNAIHRNETTKEMEQQQHHDSPRQQMPLECNDYTAMPTASSKDST